MTNPSNCDICGETYDVDNLMTCTRCDREFCYRCGSSGVCTRCERARAAE